MIGQVVIKNTAPQKGECLILPVFENNFKNLSVVDSATRKVLETKMEHFEFTGKKDEMLVHGGAKAWDNIVVVGLGEAKDFSLKHYKNTVANVLRRATLFKCKEVTTVYFDKLGRDFFEAAKHASLAFFLTNYRFNKYKSEEERKKMRPPEVLNFYVGKNPEGRFKEGAAYANLVAQGIYLTRDMINEPASAMSPTTMAQVAYQLEKESKGKVSVEVLDEPECRKLGMGSYLGVAQGSDEPAKFIILRYNEKAKGKKICLIGKSITFDSGGLSLKPSEYMEDMKIDMSGGATVLGVFKVLSQISDLKAAVIGVLPACENMPSGKAMRPGDVVTALNGKSIEVLNTDAEGRLALADALSYAEKYLKPDIIVDIATLTGACAVALGNDIAGLFGSDSELNKKYKEITDREGDEAWELPLYTNYLKGMKSLVADMKNISGGRYGGAITAALFLTNFVEKPKWIHLDIAGPAHRMDEPMGVWDRGATGWGVASLVELVRSV